MKVPVKRKRKNQSFPFFSTTVSWPETNHESHSRTGRQGLCWPGSPKDQVPSFFLVLTLRRMLLPSPARHHTMSQWGFHSKAAWVQPLTWTLLNCDVGQASVSWSILFDCLDEAQIQLCLHIVTQWLYLKERNPAKSFLSNQLIQNPHSSALYENCYCIVLNVQFPDFN